jgi:hypothetical protein
MCDPHGFICSKIEQSLKSKGFKPSWNPHEHLDIVLAIAKCASTKSGYTTYYPYRSIGWSGFPEYAIKYILTSNGWVCKERAFKGRTGFYRPPC